MTGLEAIGTIAGAFVVGGVAALSLVGKIINAQVKKSVSMSFETAVNNDEPDNPGLRTSLKKLRAEVKFMSDKITLIEQYQATLTERLLGRNQLCDQRHETLNKEITRLEAR